MAKGTRYTPPEYDHEAFKRRLKEDPLSGRYPPDFFDRPLAARNAWFAANQRALNAETDRVLGADSLSAAAGDD
jgi:hypothetical protein